VAVCLVALVGMLAMVLDAGLLMDHRRQCQAAADTAALAAATDLFVNWNTNQGTDPKGSAKNSGLVNASDNGFTNDGVTNTVTLNFNPSTYQLGQTAGQTIPAGYVEAIIQYDQPRYFSSIWGSAKTAVVGRAVARASYQPASPAMLVLDPSGSSVTISGTNIINLNGGSFVVNSTSGSAAVSSGSPAIQAGQFYFSGSPGYLYSGSSPWEAPNGSAAPASTITSGATPTPDPLANLPVPSMPSQNGTVSVNGGAFTTVTSTLVISGSSPVTLTPGYYPDGIVASGSAMITLQPGLYYMGGQIDVSGSIGFQVSGAPSSQTGTGVMFYNSGSAAFTFSGTGPMNIPAPSTGTYQGISIFEDRSSTQAITLSGSENQTIGGTIYAAGGSVTLSGTATATVGSTVMGAQYIVYKLTISGSGSITVNHQGGTPVRTIQLVQ
jgi:hypothetical protein